MFHHSGLSELHLQNSLSTVTFDAFIAPSNSENACTSPTRKVARAPHCEFANTGNAIELHQQPAVCQTESDQLKSNIDRRGAIQIGIVSVIKFLCRDRILLRLAYRRTPGHHNGDDPRVQEKHRFRRLITRLCCTCIKPRVPRIPIRQNGTPAGNTCVFPSINHVAFSLAYYRRVRY